MKALLRKWVIWANERFASRPSRAHIFESLNLLFEEIEARPAGKLGIVIPFEWHDGKFIIFSDQHKGAGDGADDFVAAVPNYLAALKYYNDHNYTYINLGDAEELWENTLTPVKKFHEASFAAERQFVERNAFVKVLGNHDLFWGNDPLAWWQVKDIFKTDLKVYEGVVLATSMKGRQLLIRCTHGHQGDLNSDGNWFSKFFVSKIWAPFQSWLGVNPNTPAYDAEEKTRHNQIMYEWAAGKSGSILITGHTHQPVFASLTHLERLYKQYQFALKNDDGVNKERLEAEIKKREREYDSISVDYATMLPNYFNSGCCCLTDGDMTGIEIADGFIRLIKWTSIPEGPQRQVLEERELYQLF